MMLARQHKQEPQAKCTPNVLPCAIQHNGPVDASERVWAPDVNSNGTLTAHFRGRRLQGKAIKVPNGYRGAVVIKNNHDNLSPSTKTDPRQSANPTESDDDPDDAEEEVGLYQEVSAFDDIISWAHESLPDQTTDVHIKGIQEWLQFAEKINSFPAPANENAGAASK